MKTRIIVIIWALGLVITTLFYSPVLFAATVEVPLSGDVFGIGTLNVATSGPGIDGAGDTYPSNLLGRSVSYAGSTFTFAAPGATSAASSKVITLTAGKYNILSFLGTGTGSNQANQEFIVTYTDGTKTTFTQSLSNWNTPANYRGETIVATAVYKLLPTGKTQAGSYNVYGYSFALNAAKTVKSLSLPANSHVVVLAIDLISTGSPVEVGLAGLGNVYGIGKLNTAVTGKGIDGRGDAYPSNLLGSSISFASSHFAFSAPGPASAVSSKILRLPAGKYQTLSFLGTAVNSNQVNQSFIVTYTDGTKTTFIQSMSNWNTPAHYRSEAIVTTVAYKLLQNGTTQSGAYNVYGYTFALNPAKTVQSLTLPTNANVVLLAFDLTPAPPPPPAATPVLSPAGGTYTTAVTVKITDSTSGAAIYVTTDGSTPTTSSKRYSAPFAIASNAKTSVKAIAVASGFADSVVAAAVYSVNVAPPPVAATPTISLPSGVYGTPFPVTLADTTPGAKIYYTIDGSTPSATHGTLYTGSTLSFGDGNIFPLTLKAIAVATGFTNSAVATAVYRSATPPPTGLTYPATPPLLVGKPVYLNPSYSGYAVNWSISPQLPAGLTLDTNYGIISGTPTALANSTGYKVTASNNSGQSTSTLLSLEVDSGPTVHLSATASDAQGNQLNYVWRITDGQVFNMFGPQADWTLPQGPGLHFAYVLVTSAATGGCAEARVVVNTDAIGAPAPPAFGPMAATVDASRVTAKVSAETIASMQRRPTSIAPSAAIAASSLSGVTPLAVPSLKVEQVQICQADPFFQNAAATGPFFAPDIPSISAVSASYNGSTSFGGTPIGQFQNVFPVVNKGQPSDLFATQNFFLSKIGTDSWATSCQYFADIGAFTRGPAPCASPRDPLHATYPTALTFDDWKRQVGIDQYTAPGDYTIYGFFLNAVDLNLTREHHVNGTGLNTGGFYVCNHPGPVDANGNPVIVDPDSPGANQTYANTAIQNAINQKNLLACVAMDRNGNNGNNFTRFFAFGPSGELLPSVNLDGRGEKFLPGACIACHGRSQNYTPQGYQASTGNPGDVGAQYLPFDGANFVYSTQPGVYDYRGSVEYLNQSVKYNTIPTQAALNLINAFGTQDKNPAYVPQAWQSQPDPTFYSTVVARSCRTCHASLQNYDLDDVPGFLSSAYADYVCGSDTADPNNHLMPNSLVTFNRLWNSSAQTSALQAHFAALGVTSCTYTNGQ